MPFRTPATLPSMRTRGSPSVVALVAAALAVTVVLGAPGARAQEDPTAIDEADWEGVLGVRAPVSTAQRYVVLLSAPSLAERVRTNGGEATEKEMVAWTTSAVAQQEQFLARLAAVGARIAPEFRYTKVVNRSPRHPGGRPSHPYLRQRVLSGVDVLNPGSGGIAQPHPTIPGRPERHATEL